MKKIGTKIKLIYNINLWYNENPIVYAADNSGVKYAKVLENI